MTENPLQRENRKKRDEEIVKLWPSLTLQEIGKKYGISHERVRQIINKKKGRKTKTI